MIPYNRPAIGKDLQVFQRENGLTIDEARYLFGLTMNKWCDFVNKYGDEPISNTAVALLVRLYDEFPELIPEQKKATPAQLYGRILEIDPEYTEKRFSLLLGRESSNGFRWLKREGAASPTVKRIAYHLYHDILRKGSRGLRQWENIVEMEARARGVENFWIAGRWNPGTQAKSKSGAPTSQDDGASQHASQTAPESTSKRSSSKKRAVS